MRLSEGHLNSVHARTISHPRRTFPGIYPDTAHLRLDLARAIIPDPSTRAIADFLGTVHRTRHTRLAEHAVAAHTAIKKYRLDIALDAANWSLNPVVAEPQPQWVQSYHQAFKMIVKPLEQTGITDRPLSD